VVTWAGARHLTPGDYPLWPGSMTLLYHFFLFLTLTASLGGTAYYLIAIVAVRKFRKTRLPGPRGQGPLPPMSLFKPLGGINPGLEEHLEGFFRQDYPSFEILFAVERENDPALPVVRRLMARYPNLPTRLLITGQSPYANAKVFSMEKMAEVARHPIWVITDDDTSVNPEYLRAMACCFEPTKAGAVTNLYRGVAGPDFWSKLEALGMSTEFMAGVVVAEHFEGMRFTLGPSMAVVAGCLSAVGGFAALAEYLADDFVLGQRISQTGYQVTLSRHTVNHHASSTGFVNSFVHRLRWNRSSRFSRPAGYLGQGFTYGLPWALALCLAAPSCWSGSALLCSLAARGWLALELGVRLLEDKTVLRRLWLVPLQDVLSFASWLGGFLGREIVWRNGRYRLLDGGRFARLGARYSDGGSKASNLSCPR
jgi:ceramide glucosyltransferase